MHDFRDFLEQSNSENKNGATENKKKGRHRHRLLCELLLDFAKNTTLHGLRYVTEHGLSLVEKIFWITIFILSLAVCIVLIRKVWVKWQTNPPFVTFSEQLTYVTEVPFPAVTICPQEKIDQKMYNYTKSFTDLENNWRLWLTNKTLSADSESFMNELAWIRLTCNDFTGDTGIIPYFFNRSHDDHNAVQNIIKVAPKLEQFFFISRWRNQLELDPFIHYSQVLLEEGVCYTFNSLAADEILNMDSIQKNYSYLNESTPRKGWSVEGGYASSGHDTYPRRGRASGSRPDFYLNLRQVQNRDNMCDGNEPGFKVYLHHPSDLPQSSLYYYTVYPSYVNTFAISVDVLKTTESLHRCPPNIRQCYFPGEKKLRYFVAYSQNNCRLECLANYTLLRCRCVWFHMPHNDSTVLCHFNMKECVNLALEQYISDDGINNANSSQCQCLPSCSSIQYKAEILKTSAKFMQCHTCKSDNNTYIDMYFKKSTFMSKARECSGMFELTDFLAYCGGLLGLFLGFSFLSVIEILYFCTLRLGCVLRRDNQAKKENNTIADPETNNLNNQDISSHF